MAKSRRFRDLLNELVPGDPTPGLMLRAFRKRAGFTLKDMETITEIKESNLSALENDKIRMTRHYAEIFAAALDVSPTAFMYPNGEFKKDAALLRIEKRRDQLLRSRKKTS